MANVEDLTINAKLSFSVENEKEIDSVKSSFSVLQIVFQDLNKDGNEFLQTLKNLNIDSSTLQKSLSDIGNINPNLELVISANDPNNVLDQVGNLHKIHKNEIKVGDFEENEQEFRLAA